MNPPKSSAPQDASRSSLRSSSARLPAPAPVPALRKPQAVTHGALTRMEFIHERLREVRADNTVKVTRQSLAAELCRSRGAINKDIQCMRETFSAPIAWCPVRGTLYYIHAPGQPPYELRPRATIGLRGALALVLSTRRLFPFGDSLGETLRKLAPLIDGGLTFDINLLDTVCSAPETPATEADLAHLELLLDAIGRRCEVRLKYAKLLPGARPGLRTVHPLHVVLFADSCLVVVHDPACNERRNLELARIRDAQLTGATFLTPADFDLRAYLAGGVDRFLGEAKHELRIRFAPVLARYVEERPWQRGQLLEKFPDGSAEATYRVAHPRAIEQRVLAAGGLAEVLSPPDSRARLRTAAETLQRAHGAPPSDHHSAFSDQRKAA